MHPQVDVVACAKQEEQQIKEKQKKLDKGEDVRPPKPALIKPKVEKDDQILQIKPMRMAPQHTVLEK